MPRHLRRHEPAEHAVGTDSQVTIPLYDANGDELPITTQAAEYRLLRAYPRDRHKPWRRPVYNLTAQATVYTPPEFEERGVCEINGEPFVIITTDSAYSGTNTAPNVYRATDGLFYNRGGLHIAAYDWVDQSIAFNGDVADPLGLYEPGSGGFGINQDGSVLYMTGRVNNTGRLMFADNATKTLTKKIGTGSTFFNRYELPAMASGRTTIFHQVHRNGVDELIALIGRNDFNSASHINVFNPNLETVTNPARDYFVGTAREGVETASGMNCGWPVIDKDLHVWSVASNDDDTLIVYEWEWDITENSLENFEVDGIGTFPTVVSETDLSAAVTAALGSTPWGGSGDWEVPATWIEQTNQLLFAQRWNHPVKGHGAYFFLFDCATKQLVSPAGILAFATGGLGGNTWLHATMRGGVGVDGRMIIQESERAWNELDVQNWTLASPTPLYNLDGLGISNNTAGGGGYVPEYNAVMAVRGPLSGSGNLGAAQLICLDEIRVS